MSETAGAFAKVDESESGQQLASYLDAAGALQAAQAYKQQSYQLVGATEGKTILDAGCGTGDDVRAMAGMVGPNGMVVGIDSNEHLVEEANRRLEGSGLSARFQKEDIHQLPFEDNTFDGCRSDRVFQHLDDRKKALSELIRVAKPGAPIFVSDPDWDTITIDSSNTVLTRALIHKICDNISNGWCGRNMCRLFKEAGLSKINIVPATVVLPSLMFAEQHLGISAFLQKMVEDNEVEKEAADQWLVSLKEDSEKGLFFCSLTGFITHGYKPEA